MKRIILFSMMFLLMQLSFGSLPNGDLPSQKDQTVQNVVPSTLFKENGKIDHKKLRSMASSIKGEKLTLKEKIALKIFGKKIATKYKNAAAGEGKSQVVALILVILVGGLGIHRFYLGYTWQGIVQLLTAGGFGIWWLIDLIRIITGDLKPKDGEYGTTL